MAKNYSSSIKACRSNITAHNLQPCNKPQWIAESILLNFLQGHWIVDPPLFFQVPGNKSEVDIIICHRQPTASSSIAPLRNIHALTSSHFMLCSQPTVFRLIILGITQILQVVPEKAIALLNTFIYVSVSVWPWYCKMNCAWKVTPVVLGAPSAVQFVYYGHSHFCKTVVMYILTILHFNSLVFRLSGLLNIIILL